MKKIITIAAVAALTASSIASAQSFEEAYNTARAQQGANGTFEWNGKKYNTLREEEVMAAKPATQANADALIAAAKAKHKEAREAGFAWRDTTKRIKEAMALAKEGKFQEAMDLAARAHYQARMGLVQRDYSEKHWIDAVPPLN